MTKQLIFITCCLLSSLSSSYAQKLPDFGLGRVRLTEADRTITAELLPVKREPSIETDRKYYWYSGNQVHITQGGYSGKLLNGHYNEYYLNKNLKEQGEYKTGLKTGLWRSWNESGNLAQVVNWKDGLRSGEFSTYDESGKLKQAGTYAHDQLHGKLITYISKDSTLTEKYKDGTLVVHKAKLQGKPSFLQKLWPFKKKPASAEKVKVTKPPKVKKQRKPKVADAAPIM
jgi:hypothetical protein